MEFVKLWWEKSISEPFWSFWWWFGLPRTVPEQKVKNRFFDFFEILTETKLPMKNSSARRSGRRQTCQTAKKTKKIISAIFFSSVSKIFSGNFRFSQKFFKIRRKIVIQTWNIEIFRLRRAKKTGFYKQVWIKISEIWLKSRPKVAKFFGAKICSFRQNLIKNTGSLVFSVCGSSTMSSKKNNE